MKALNLAILAVLVTLSSTRQNRFYDNPVMRYYYPYHPYRGGRSVKALDSVKSEITFQGGNLKSDHKTNRNSQHSRTFVFTN